MGNEGREPEKVGNKRYPTTCADACRNHIRRKIRALDPGWAALLLVLKAHALLLNSLWVRFPPPRPMKPKNKMLNTLKAVLQCLEQHLDDEARRLKVHRDQLCPCSLYEVAQAKIVIAEAENINETKHS